LKNIRLSTEIFNLPAFKALIDFSYIIPPDPNPGRPNPFAPIGTDVMTSSGGNNFFDLLGGLDGADDDVDTSGNGNAGANSNNNNNDDETPSAVNSVRTSNATGVGRTSAILNGEILRSAEGTEQWFEYGTSSTLSGALSTPRVTQSNIGVYSRTLSNLAPTTTYYFRASATFSGVTLSGEVKTFTTLP